MPTNTLKMDQPPMASEPVMRFNAAIEHFDAITDFKYDDYSPWDVLRYLRGAYGSGDFTTRSLNASMHDIGYRIEPTQEANR